jgi:hypothetical protein
MLCCALATPPWNSSEPDMENYWDLLARQFHHQQPPLRPSAEDAAIFSGIIRNWHRTHSPAQTNLLLLGVTPEIASLPLPAHSSLVAIEQSQAMIDIVWPGNIPNQREVLRGNWFDIDLTPRVFDLVLGDGFTTGMAYPDQYRTAAKRISEWLRPKGLLVARLFIRSEKKETHDRILSDLKDRGIRRFDILKWRLGMASQNSVQEGVLVEEIHRAWTDLERDWPSLPEDAGWPRPTVDTIKLYAGRNHRYHFPTIAEISDEFGDRLELVSTTFPKYDFGECCPILVFRRR